MTDSDQLAALARAAGLRLSAQDLEALTPAWRRYVALVEELKNSLAIDPLRDLL